MANTTYYNLVIYDASTLIGSFVNNNATIIDNALHAHDLAIAAIKTMTGATAGSAGAGGLVPAPAAGAQGKFLRGDGTWQSAPSYSEATSSTYGLVKTGYTTSGKNYAVQLSSGKMYVSVPWENTTYSQATSSSLGLVKIGYSASGKYYAVQLDGSGKMYVYVPWTDNNTTYSEATSSTYGLVKIGYSGSGKYYPVQLSGGKMYVYVPWTDTNTTYSNFTTSAAGLVPASGNANKVLAGNGWATLQNLINVNSAQAFNTINGWQGKLQFRYGTVSNIESKKDGTVWFSDWGGAFPNHCFHVSAVLMNKFEAAARVTVMTYDKNAFTYNMLSNNGANLTFSFFAFGD